MPRFATFHLAGDLRVHLDNHPDGTVAFAVGTGGQHQTAEQPFEHIERELVMEPSIARAIGSALMGAAARAAGR